MDHDLKTSHTIDKCKLLSTCKHFNNVRKNYGINKGALRYNKLCHWLMNFLLPPQCNLCKQFLNQPYSLCFECWQKLEPTKAPQCKRCGVAIYSVNFLNHDNGVCSDCLVRPPLYDAATAPLIYNAEIKRLILRFKNYDQLQLAHLFAKFMAPCIPKNIDYLIPVPLFWKKLMVRQYNQSLELIKALKMHTSIPALNDGLIRITHGSIKDCKNRSERYDALEGAFIANPKYDFTNAKILLIDDVITSGATANACTFALKQAGATKVKVLAVARTQKNKELVLM